MDWQKRKLLSQNFLLDRELVKQLVRRSSVGKSDTVIEIGPGKGIITEQLLEVAGKVISVELDKNLHDTLINKFRDVSNFKPYNLDFRLFALPNYPYKVFSNIPFRFTTEFIHKLLRSKNPPKDCYLIVQKELADKLIKGSLISVLYYPYFEFSIQHRFSQTDFSPIPRVNIVLLRIIKREKPLVESRYKSIFADFVTYVFTQKKPHIVKLNKSVAKISPDDWMAFFNDHLNNLKELKYIKGSAQKLLLEQDKLQKIRRTRNDKSWKRFRY